MKNRRHTPVQITRKLREADRFLAEGKTISEVAKYLEIFEFLEGFCNRRRRHSYLGWLSPVEFEGQACPALTETALG